jgi:hypothetical protein
MLEMTTCDSFACYINIISLILSALMKVNLRYELHKYTQQQRVYPCDWYHKCISTKVHIRIK